MRHSILISFGIIALVAVSVRGQVRSDFIGPPLETQGSIAFRIRFDPALQTSNYSGRLYVIVADADGDEPRLEAKNWFRPPRLFAKDVEGVGPAEGMSLDDSALFFPKPLRDLPQGEYRVQAIARRSLDHPVPGQGPGDLYSQAVSITLDTATGFEIDFLLDRMVAETPFEDSSGVRAVELVSEQLSRFHGRPVKLRAAVVLPADWVEASSRKYPVLYMIPGFGGDHHMAKAVARARRGESPGHQVLFVVPDPTCYRGHSVFADSENNGPWGRAFIEELIPYVEKRFHGDPTGRHRYVTGASSGGWSALWLQITYPETFSGCWSHCPDPVDFRDFQQIDLYAEDSNMYTDAAGQPRPLARMGDRVAILYEEFVRREEVLGAGGQIRSFEGVFSRRGPDGRPESFFDANTGLVNTAVTRTWERYDLRLILERNWTTLGPKLAGKLHIFAGGKDTFYLEGAVVRLKEALAKLVSDAEVVIVPNMPHGMAREAIEPMYQTILTRFRDGR